jgi:3-carboxy-cis,cis-muconate cycloisomerase
VVEAVMMGLAPPLGRGEAHRVVRHACDIALSENLLLADGLARDQAVPSRLDRAAIDRLTDPACYLGGAHGIVDPVLAASVDTHG